MIEFISRRAIPSDFLENSSLVIRYSLCYTHLPKLKKKEKKKQNPVFIRVIKEYIFSVTVKP